jgi:hypothetical protein
MNRKYLKVSLVLGLSLIVLSACSNSGLIPPTSSSTPSSSQSQKKATSSTSSSSKQGANTSVNLKAEEAFVQKFLIVYTTYGTLNAQKAAIQPLLTEAMQKQLAVTSAASPDLNSVTSNGLGISVWHNDDNQWLGLVTIKINDQTSSVQVFLITLEPHGDSYLVSQLSSPTQE